ncbi:MAG: hypothetical protein JKX92_01000 [Porticoccaceae bacterium]|nr:hypothetical protein [Porticoccaceae bacterium]
MEIEIFSGIKWIACRVFIHMVFMACLGFLSFFFTKNIFLVIGVFSVIAGFYAILVVAQIRVPLLKTNKSLIAKSDFFKMDVGDCRVGDIDDITYEKYRITFHFESQRMNVDLIGMPYKKILENQELVRKWFGLKVVKPL